MYPSLEVPVIGSELIPLNLTVLYCPRRGIPRDRRVLRARGGGRQNLQSGSGLEGGQIEKAGDSLHVEQMQLLGASGQTHRDDGRPGQERISFPPLERQVRQHIVIADDDVGRAIARRLGGGVDPYRVVGDNAYLGEVPRYVLTEKAMTRDAQR